MAAKYTLRVDQGATTRRTITWTNALANPDGTPILDAAGNMRRGEPINLTGYVARMKVRAKITDSEATLSLTTGSGITIPTQPTTLHTQVRATSTANLALLGTQTVDGVALTVGDRVLAKDQTVPADNGIYVVAAGAWARASDANQAAELTAGNAAWTHGGTTNAGKTYTQSLTVTNVGVDAQSWDEDARPGQILVTITDEQSAALESSGVYDLEVESAGGEVTRILQGKLRLSAEVTR